MNGSFRLNFMRSSISEHAVVWACFSLLLLCYHLIFKDFFPNKHGLLGHDFMLASPALRQQATDLLTKMGGSAVELLVDVLLHSTSEIRPIVGSLLERLAGMDRFLENMASMDPQQRLRAAEAVGAIGGPRAVDAIVGTLSDPDERVRIRSLELLGDLGDQRAIDVVRKSFLGDPVPEVVDAAKKALAKLRPGETA